MLWLSRCIEKQPKQFILTKYYFIVKEMNLSDHLLPLLRDHDCVIIPDFGGLVAEYAPAHVQPGGRHVLHPPTRQVAFNQALTRNDGLLVDALRQHLNLPTEAAREAVRQAVAGLRQQLHSAQRTELPGIGVFQQLAGRGLQFEYTGTANLLPAAFGLPDLTAYPVRATDVRLAREQQAELVPRLRAAGRGLRLRRVLPGAAVGLLAGLAVAALYLASLHPNLVPVAWREYVPQWQQSAPAPQQATLAAAGAAPLATPAASSASENPAPQLLATPAANSPANTQTTAAVAAPKATVTQLVTVAPAALPAARPAAGATAKAAAVVPAHRPARLLAAKGSWHKTGVAARPLGAATVRKVAAPVAAGTMKAQAGRFYVVVGSFQSLIGARQVQAKLLHTGRPSRVLLPDFTTRKYRVTAAEFASRPAAFAALPRLSVLEKGAYVYPVR